MVGDILQTLNYFGITHDRVLPFVILTIEMVYISYRFTNPIKKSIGKIKNAIIEIQTIAVQNGTIIRHHLVESSGSPLGPTEYGKKLIVDSGLGKILDNNKSFLEEKLTNKLKKNFTEYDVQESARTLLIELKADVIMNPVKNYAFQNGIDVDIILRAGGLWLRDDYLGRERTVHGDD